MTSPVEERGGAGCRLGRREFLQRVSAAAGATHAASRTINSDLCIIGTAPGLIKRLTPRILTHDAL